jgi:hypothetical protein
MAKYGGSSEAIAFYAETGLFPIAFEEMGKVDVVRTFDIRRANSNDDTMLVNGSPRMVRAGGDVSHHPSYARISTAISDYDSALGGVTGKEFIAWGADIILLRMADSPSGGQSFIFDLPLTDGCHACEIGYVGSIALDFNPNGSYEGSRALEPCVVLGTITYVDLGAAQCEKQRCLPLAAGCLARPTYVGMPVYDGPAGQVTNPDSDCACIVRVREIVQTADGEKWAAIDGLDGGGGWALLRDLRVVQAGEAPRLEEVY